MRLSRRRRWVLVVGLLAVFAPSLAAIDAFKNGVRVTVSTGYDASAVSIVLTTGGGATLPAPSFNCTWYNFTDYPDSSSDPNVEYVRVTGVASETLTITRAQESSVAATHNTAGKTYKLECTLTAKTLTEIAAEFAGPRTVATGGTGASTLTGILKGNGTSAVTAVALPSDAARYLDGTGAFTVPAGSATGTVTSVALTLPNLFSVAGSPVTSDGSLDATLATQAANKVFAGPTSGSAAMPAFRSLVTADLSGVTLPAVSLTSGVSGVLPVANGGTALASGTSGGILGFTATGTLASSTALTANQLVLGGGAGATPTTLGSLGTTTTLLHGNAAGAPTFGAVSLTADVSGILPTANGGTGIQYFTAAGPSTTRTYTFPDASTSIPGLDQANAFTATQSITKTSLATTSTDGDILQNTTAATSGVTVQISPRTRWRGTAWDTSASETVDFFAETLPATAATPTGLWKLGYSLNGAGATYPLTVSSIGALTTSGGGGLTTSGVVSMSGSGTSSEIRMLNSTISNGQAVGQITLMNTGRTIGSNLKVDALPTVTSCGTGSPAVDSQSTPLFGSVTVGTGGPTTCTITFGGTAYPHNAICVASVATSTAGNTRAIGTSASATVLTLVPATAWADGSVVNWICGSGK